MHGVTAQLNLHVMHSRNILERKVQVKVSPAQCDVRLPRQCEVASACVRLQPEREVYIFLISRSIEVLGTTTTKAMAGR